MKIKLLLCLALLAASANLFQSCNSEEEPIVRTGKVSFSVNSQSSTGGREADGNVPTTVIVTILNAAGEPVFSQHSLPVLDFGTEYMTTGIDLPIGSYSLTEFVVLNSDNIVIYAAPTEDSPLSSEVADPLPMEFEVTEEITTLVTPEVLSVADIDDPADFGYASFGFVIVTPGPDATVSLEVPIGNYSESVASVKVWILNLGLPGNQPPTYERQWVTLNIDGNRATGSATVPKGLYYLEAQVEIVSAGVRNTVTYSSIHNKNVNANTTITFAHASANTPWYRFEQVAGTILVPVDLCDKNVRIYIAPGVDGADYTVHRQFDSYIGDDHIEDPSYTTLNICVGRPECAAGGITNMGMMALELLEYGAYGLTCEQYTSGAVQITLSVSSFNNDLYDEELLTIR